MADASIEVKTILSPEGDSWGMIFNYNRRQYALAYPKDAWTAEAATMHFEAQAREEHQFNGPIRLEVAAPEPIVAEVRAEPAQEDAPPH